VRKGASAGHAVAHVAAHQDAALVVHVVAEGQLGDVAAIERDEERRKKPPNSMPPVP
jgi:hypothetical protein